MKKSIYLIIIFVVVLSSDARSEAPDFPDNYQEINAEHIASVEQELSTEFIDGSDGFEFWPGTYFIYKTNMGRYGKFIVEDLYGSNLTISWITYDSDGSTYSSGSGLEIHGTWSCDLDEGLDEGYVWGQQDWYWEQVNGSTRYLYPTNGAKLKLIYRASSSQAQELVYFADDNLKAAVEETLDVTDPTSTDMLRLRFLDADNRGIIDLTGLEYATNIRRINLIENQVSDISALSGLINLEILELCGNQASDISPLAGLISLRHLCLTRNQISNISPLSSLTNLEYLQLQNNQISDISPLSGLTNLLGLYLMNNHISDISAFSSLPNIEWLYLSNNRISDISPLSELTTLKELFLNSNQVSDISPLADLTKLERVRLDDNQISDISPLSELTNLRELYLWANPLGEDAYNVHIPLIQSSGVEVSYDPLVWRALTIDSTSGGSVVEPGEGDFDYTNLTIVNVNAIADVGYRFNGWTGTAVDAGNVANPAAAGTTVTMEEDYTLQANFEQTMLDLYVDDDALNDPAPNNPQVSDPDEDGTLEHPYDTIQEAIDVAEHGGIVLVYPGIYQEEIIFMGKAITVQGVATSDGIPVLENPDDFAVSFYNAEGPDSILKNFVIRNSFIAVFIAGSSPTISNLTVVGNKYGIEAYVDSEPDISNSIFWNNTDGNLFQCEAWYSCIEGIDLDTNHGNIGADPLFVDPANGDYHLRSKRGRYWPEHDIWVLDSITSPCIDAGDQMADPSQEPMPNGGRINMGAYGGTAYASMSESSVTGEELPLGVIEQVHGIITVSFPYEDNTWFIVMFHNDSVYTITQVILNIRLTDEVTSEQECYEVVLGPPGAIIPPGETVILSGDVGVTRGNKDFSWEIVRMLGYID